ncbi:MAG: D-alanyl-D-alanine carboxypeptidase [Clostridiales bacterium]|nr:D-alanyl-D-alanine carboxypeptidase [Clostridiales bacterium]
MRKLCLLFCALSVCFTVYISIQSPLSASASAAAEIAMELTTGTTLSERNADARLPMASTTKIMTAIIIIEDCNLDEELTVDDKAVGIEGSSIYLKKDEQIDVRDLLYGLMLRSGNDSATALAIHHSGSVEKFVEVMNSRAKTMGAENTSFTNPSGLPDENHYTTARDLCKIACYAMNNEIFKEVVGTKNYSGKFRSFFNKNKMLSMCDGANGVKTGYTLKAGRCLVSSCEREGMDVVSVVLNCPEMYERSCEIFEECFSKYSLVKIDENNIFMSDRVLCKVKKSRNFVANKGNLLDFRVKLIDNDKKQKSGGAVAILEISDQNGLLFEEKLYSI